MGIWYNTGTKWNKAQHAWRGDGATEWVPQESIHHNMPDPFIQIDPPRIWLRVFVDTPAVPPVAPTIAPTPPTTGAPPGERRAAVQVGAGGSSNEDWWCLFEVYEVSTGLLLGSLESPMYGFGGWGGVIELPGYSGKIVHTRAAFFHRTPLGTAYGPWSAFGNQFVVPFPL